MKLNEIVDLRLPNVLPRRIWSEVPARLFRPWGGQKLSYLFISQIVWSVQTQLCIVFLVRTTALSKTRGTKSTGRTDLDHIVFNDTREENATMPFAVVECPWDKSSLSATCVSTIEKKTYWGLCPSEDGGPGCPKSSGASSGTLRRSIVDNIPSSISSCLS